VEDGVANGGGSFTSAPEQENAISKVRNALFFIQLPVYYAKGGTRTILLPCFSESLDGWAREVLVRREF
jgi:hypothetical protein